MKIFLVMCLSVLVVGCLDVAIIGGVHTYYCDKLAGERIYEKVPIYNKHLLDIPESTVEARKLDPKFFMERIRLISMESVPKGLKRIDETRFAELYRFEPIVRTDLFSVGPVYKMVSRITRKKDQKVMSEMTTITKRPGWVTKMLAIGPVNGKSCTDAGRRPLVSGSGVLAHQNIIRNTVMLTD